MKKLLVLLLGLSLLAGSALALTLNGAGATFPYPIYSKWFSDYQKETGVQINYAPIGSGGGIRQFTAGVVDFGASDAPMTNSEIAKAGGDVLHIPTVAGAVADRQQRRAGRPEAGRRNAGRDLSGRDQEVERRQDRRTQPRRQFAGLNIKVVYRSDSQRHDQYFHATTWPRSSPTGRPRSAPINRSPGRSGSAARGTRGWPARSRTTKARSVTLNWLTPRPINLLHGQDREPGGEIPRPHRSTARQRRPAPASKKCLLTFACR